MRYRLIGCVAGLAMGWSVAFMRGAENPPPAKETPQAPMADTSAPAVPAAEATSVQLSADEAKVAERFKRLKDKLLHMADMVAGTNPRQAMLLRRAVAKSDELNIDDQFGRLVDLLKEEKLGLGIKGQDELGQGLAAVLELLINEDRHKQLESEKARIRAYLKQINNLMKEQRTLQGKASGDADAHQTADEQNKLADKTGELAREIEQKEGKPQSPSDGDQRNAKDAQGKGSKPSDGKPNDGKSKDGKSKDGDSKDGDSKDGQPKDGQPKGDQSPDRKSPDGKPQDGNSPEGKPKDGEKSDTKDKSDKEHSEKDKPGQESDGKPQDKDHGKESKDKSQQGKTPQQGQEGQPSDKQPQGEQKPGDQSQQGQQGQSPPDGEQPPPEDQRNPTQKRVENAQRRMREATERLEKAKREEAREKQQQALEELAQAKAELEAILRQLREEEQAQTLKLLQARFMGMLKMQNEVLEGTKRADKVPEAERDSDDFIEAGRLSRKEAEIVAEADKALALLHEEPSTVAFPEALSDVREQMQQVVTRLAQAKVGQLTQGIEQDIVASLEELITALKKVQKDRENKQKARQQPGQKQQGGQQGDPPLVDSLSEIKMIRSLQVRVNDRTKRYGEMIQSEQTDKPELISALRDLAAREERIRRVTRDIVVGRNQ